MVDRKQIILRCDDYIEALVFTKYLDGAFGPEYEFSIKDCYLGHNYKGFFGRLKRAWQAFKAQPLIYNSVYVEDPKRAKKFLESCLKTLESEVNSFNSEELTNSTIM
jgi:hypothetical protein